MVESLVELRREAVLDFDRPQLSAWYLQYQVDFSTGGRSIKARLHSLRCRAKQVFQYEPFPASAGTRGPSCGISRSRYVRMKFSRQTALAPSLSARKLSGKPPLPDPEFLARIAIDFEHVECPQLDIGNAASQGFA